MPQVFDKIGRDAIREQLFEQGFELIKQYGIKKTSVAEIAKKAGIATGTFYSFFPSKEEYIYRLVLYKRSIVKEMFAAIIAQGKVNKESFYNYLYDVYRSDHNVFDYLNDAEIDMLNARWPAEYWKNQENDEKATRWILDHLEGVSPDCDWKVFANLSKSISLIRYGRTRLYQEKYDEMLAIYIDAIVRYVFQDPN